MRLLIAVSLLSLLLLACSNAVAAASSSSSAFTSGKVSISTLDGSSRLSDSFTPTHGADALAVEKGVKLDSDELIRVSFSLAESSEGSLDEEEDVTGAPTQVVIQLKSTVDPTRIFSWSAVPANKKNGKVSWSQRVDRLPLHRLSVAGLAGAVDPVFSLELLLGGKKHALALQLGQVTIPYLLRDAVKASANDERRKREEELGFHRWEEKRHTFRKEVTEGMPSAKKSLVVAVILVVIPWAFLSFLLIPLVTSGSLQLFPTSPKLPTSILFASLLFLEIIGLRYYKGDFVLFKMLPLFIAGSAVASVAVLAGGVRGVGLIGGGNSKS